MAGICNVACAEGHLSLAKKRVRTAPKRQQLVPIPQLNALPLSLRRDAKRKRLPQFGFTRPSTEEITTPNILWLARVESPSNCVFFACHPYAPAVLTSTGPRFGLSCI